MTENDIELNRIRYQFEYSTRDTYGGGFDWPREAPLSTRSFYIEVDYL